jgi:hypothetical protein
MSALGQKQTFAVHQPMSALPPNADMCGAATDVRFGPIADIAPIRSPRRRGQEALAKILCGHRMTGGQHDRATGIVTRPSAQSGSQGLYFAEWPSRRSGSQRRKLQPSVLKAYSLGSDGTCNRRKWFVACAGQSDAATRSHRPLRCGTCDIAPAWPDRLS